MSLRANEMSVAIPLVYHFRSGLLQSLHSFAMTSFIKFDKLFIVEQKRTLAVNPESEADTVRLLFYHH